MKGYALLIALLFVACDESTGRRPDDLVSFKRYSEGDAAPIQLLQFRDGTALIVIGTDHNPATDNVLVWRYASGTWVQEIAKGPR